MRWLGKPPTEPRKSGFSRSSEKGKGKLGFVSVETLVGGLVELSDGSTFHNPPPKEKLGGYHSNVKLAQKDPELHSR